MKIEYQISKCQENVSKTQLKLRRGKARPSGLFRDGLKVLTGGNRRHSRYPGLDFVSATPSARADLATSSEEGSPKLPTPKVLSSYKKKSNSIRPNANPRAFFSATIYSKTHFLAPRFSHWNQFALSRRALFTIEFILTAFN